VSEVVFRGMPGLLERVSRSFRNRRMERFRRLFPGEGCRRVVDLGGRSDYWDRLGFAGAVTVVNRDPKEWGADPPRANGRFRYVVADGRQTGFRDTSFDLAFSNSVIEHVGEWEDQKRFADEMRRLAPQVYCQSPNRWFFWEPHLMTFFVHYLPRRWQLGLVRHFTLWGLLNKPSREVTAAYLSFTRLLTRKQMQELFPDCEILTERWLVFAKSFIAVRRYR
jgi:hypothetical protein